jgi:hypothetical protein
MSRCFDLKIADCRLPIDDFDGVHNDPRLTGEGSRDAMHDQ